MVYNPNANWTAATDLAAKAPTYYIAIEGITTKHYSTALVLAAGTTKKPLMRVPDQIGQKISQLQGRQTISVFSFQLVDSAGEISDLLATDKSSPQLATLINRKVTLFSGYLDLNEADFAPIAIGEISDVRLLMSGTAYSFKMRSLKRAQLEEIFTQADERGGSPLNTRLGVDADAGTRVLTLLDVSDRSEGDRLYIGPSTDSGDAGDEEKVTIASIEGLVVTLEKVLASSYDAQDEVRWATTVLRGNPINLIYAIMTGDFANATFPLTKVRGLPTGLNIAAGDIDAVGMVKERDRMIPHLELEFEEKQPSSGFRFLENKIYRHFGYPIVKGDGKLGFRLYRPAFPDDAGAGLPTLKEADIRRFEWQRPQDLHVNRVRLGVEFSLQNNEPLIVVLEDQEADQTATKEVAEIDINQTGFRDALQGVRIAETRAAVWFRRFLQEPPQVRVWTGLRKRAIEEGDVVQLTHPEIPDISTGTRGVTSKRMEVVEVGHGFRDEEMTFLLQDARFARPMFIGAAGALPDYDAASAAEREYWHIADTGDPAGNFGDGTPPYEVI